MKRVIKPEEITEKFIDVACDMGFTFGVDPKDVIAFQIYDPAEVGEVAEGKNFLSVILTGWPVVGVEETPTGEKIIVLESCFGWGKENRIECKKIYLEVG